MLPSDEHPDRITRDAYREQMKRETELNTATPDDPEQWARLLISTYGDAGRSRAVDPATFFDRLIADLDKEPTFVEAVATGRLDLHARTVVGAVCGRLIGAKRSLPLPYVDPLARYVLTRAQAARAGTQG
ncbi:hypothetical protein PX554_02295 [Sphingomonas sp. H39-1-10]|nr:hypothetical protein [Sphingomonas pollutisoli]